MIYLRFNVSCNYENRGIIICLGKFGSRLECLGGRGGWVGFWFYRRSSGFVGMFEFMFYVYYDVIKGFF